jgi:hypothetical protein
MDANSLRVRTSLRRNARSHCCTANQTFLLSHSSILNLSITCPSAGAPVLPLPGSPTPTHLLDEVQGVPRHPRLAWPADQGWPKHAHRRHRRGHSGVVNGISTRLRGAPWPAIAATMWRLPSTQALRSAAAMRIRPSSRRAQDGSQLSGFTERRSRIASPEGRFGAADA